jgi:trehalose 6-phosphate synthase
MSETMSRPERSLLTVSNRGPVEHQRGEDGTIESVPGTGGLATALRVAATLHPTIWLSSPMTETDRLIAEGKLPPPALDGVSHFVLTDPQAYELFYARFSNEVLWFLQHSLPWPEDLDREERERAWRDGYAEVNAAFAAKVVEELDSGAVRAVMFHDYHFYLAPGLVRQARPQAWSGTWSRTYAARCSVTTAWSFRPTNRPPTSSRPARPTSLRATWTRSRAQ